MTRFLNSLFNVRRGEWAITLLMFSYIYLVLVTYYLLKPARDSLFLVSIGYEQIPIVFVLIAICVVPITTAYSKAGRRLRLNQLMNYTTVVLIINLLILRWLITLDEAWIFYVFYIWVSIYGVLSTSQFWLLANAVYDPSQAKRLFVLLNLGAIFGAFTGGEVTSFLVQTMGIATEDLLFVCMALLGLTMVLLNFLWRIRQRTVEAGPVAPSRMRDRAAGQAKEKMSVVWRTVMDNRHLLFIAGLISLTMATGSFVDFQFKAVTVEAFPEKADLTAFLGKFYGRLSLASLVLQLVFAQRFIRWLGVGGIILFLPFGLLAGTAFMLVMPGLLAGVLLRGADGALKYSLDKTGRELLFLPIPLEVKKRTKIFIDVFVDRMFRGIAGAILILFTMVLHFTVQQISGVVLLLLLAWLLMAVLTRREYINAFRAALSRREIDLDPLTTNIADPSTLDSLFTALESKNERQIVYALDMLANAQDTNCNDNVRPLLAHPSAEVRKRAVQILTPGEDPTLIDGVTALLQDPHSDVRLAAFHFLFKNAGDQGGALVREYLEHSDPSLRSMALLCVAHHCAPEEKMQISPEQIESLINSESELARAQVAGALAELGNPQLYTYLKKLLTDESPDVVRAAIHSAGRTKAREFVPVLMERLADRQYRAAARNALAGYRKRITGTLEDYLLDESLDPALRNLIPGIMMQIATQESADILTHRLPELDASLKYRVIKALSKMRARYPDLRFNTKRVDASIIEESRSYYEVLHILELSRRTAHKDDGEALLHRALEEKLDRNLEQIFRFLGLRYGQNDIYSAYQGLVGNRKNLRANAIEFLDNLLGKDLKRYLLPILEQEADNVPIAHGRKLFGFGFKSWPDALAHLLGGSDHWLRACALNTIGEEATPELRKYVEQARQDRDPFVRETAEKVWNQHHTAWGNQTH